MSLNLAKLKPTSSGPVVIAEIGTNHNRDFGEAERLIRGAAAGGCDFVKFQIYEPSEIVSGRLMTADYGWKPRYGDISVQLAFANFLQTPKSWIPELASLCSDLEIGWGATIHGADGIQWAQQAMPGFIKVASMDHNNTPFLRALVNEVDVPIIASVGMASLDSIDELARILTPHNHGYALLHCTSIYPPEPEDLHLANIAFLKDRFSVVVGYSDHTLGMEAAVQARAMGACLFEKHITTDHRQSGPDHSFAMELGNLANYVTRVRSVEMGGMVGKESFTRISDREFSNRWVSLKSVVSRSRLRTGDVITRDNVYLVRPGTGIPPAGLDVVLGRALVRDVDADTPLTWGDLESA